MASDAAAAATAAWRHESGHLIAVLVQMTRDLDLAEDLAQDAITAALEQWPAQGIPANPGAWLTSVAKRRAIDHFRRNQTRRRVAQELGQALGDWAGEELVDQVDYIEDDVLRLIFLSCHPSLTPDARAALTLRLVCGLSTTEIARAFLMKDATVAQRISRAKRTLAERRVPFDLPDGAERDRRLVDVLGVIYLIFNEGYSATAGDDWMRPELCQEALRLARMLAALAPTESEVHGLQALLEIQASRTHARTDTDGEPVLLEDQDRSRWDNLLVARGFEALDRARGLDQPAGRYVLQAAIAATHARARRSQDTDWVRIAELYDVLSVAAPSPVVEVNRAVAHGRAFGAPAGLVILGALFDDPVMVASHLLHSVHGDLLERAGRAVDARAAFNKAAALTRNQRERTLLRKRADRLQ